MNDSERNYFIAAGASLEKIGAIIEQRRSCNKRRTAFKKRFGATDLILSDYEVVAMKFPDNKPPAGWIKFRRYPDSFRPSEAGKTGKALTREMRDDLRWDSSSLIGENNVAPSGMGLALHYATFEKIGDQYVISQHEAVKKIPVDAIPIKRSDYWRMKEEAEASK